MSPKPLIFDSVPQRSSIGQVNSVAPYFYANGDDGFRPDGTAPIPFTFYSCSHTVSDTSGVFTSKEASRFSRMGGTTTHMAAPDTDLFLQVACLKANVARQNAEIRVSTLVREEIVRQLFQLEFELELRSSRRAEEESSSLVAPPTSTPQKKVAKEAKEKKTKSSKDEGSSSKAPPSVAESSSKAKGKATKAKTRTAREPGKVKEKTKTQPAPPAESSKGKGKQRAPPKSKEIVEEEEEEQVSLGDDDVEMEEAAAAPAEEDPALMQEDRA